MSESHDIEQIARDAFDCERDEDEFTVFWDRGARWIIIQKSGLITVGESPLRGGCPPVQITIAELRDHVTAISAAEAKGAKSMQKRARHAIRAEIEAFLSEEYAVGQPLSSIGERFACKQCLQAIEALPLKEPA